MKKTEHNSVAIMWGRYLESIGESLSLEYWRKVHERSFIGETLK